jgi:hypothetical protein
MKQADIILRDAADARAQHLADVLAKNLASSGIITRIEKQHAGYNIQVRNHGTALEFGSFRSMPQPVVRTEIARLHSGRQS